MDLTAFGLVVDRASPVPGGYAADRYHVTCGTDDYLVKVRRDSTIVLPPWSVIES